MFFHPQVTHSSHKHPTYSRICCNYYPQKEEKHYVRLPIGGNCINYPGNKSTPTANLTTAKHLINLTISTLGAKFLGIKLANFFLNTPMLNPKYMRLHLNFIPDKIMVHYNLCNIVTPDGWVYIKIQKGMYGLPQASILANQLFEKCIATKGYYQCQHTPGLWRHVWQNIMFCLVVDEFGIKVTNMHDMDHLVNTLKEHYTIAVDMMSSLFCSIQLTWNYVQGHVKCHMPDCINNALTKYQHHKLVSPYMLPTRQHQPNIVHGFRGLRSTPHKPSPQRRSNASKTLLVPSCTMRKRLTQHLLPHSAPLQHDKATAQGQWLMHVTNSLTMLQHTPMQAFNTKRPTWYCWCTRTCPTFPNQVVKVEQQDISTHPIAMSKTFTMVPY
jgi:hypothetical protein